MTAPVFKIVEKTQSSKSWSLSDVLQDALKYEEKHPSDAGLVIRLDRKGETFHVGFANAGLTSSEAVSVLEAAKMRFLGMMGYGLTVYDRWDEK